MVDLRDFLSIVENEEFDETPVDLETFLYSDRFLGLPPLSDIQVKVVEALTQIYKPETLEKLWGEEEAKRLQRSTFKEVIMMLGKGSGKDFLSGVAFARIVYLLLCLKDPARYYGKPSGDAIHLLNVAVNAQQANNVFFAGLKKRIESCPWFDGKHHITAGSIAFEKNVTAHSGHSEREAWEGYNLLVVVLDEIAAFATEAETTGDNKHRANTADAVYRMYKASVSSRFPKNGKLALLSFPRFKGDYITQRYDEVVAEKNTIIRQHIFKVKEDLEDGIADNEFAIEWEEDRIISYTEDDVFALKRPTWEVNPIIDINDLKSDFYRRREDSLGRFACMPPEAVDGWLKDRIKVQNAFNVSKPGPFLDDWTFRDDFQPVPGKKYYLHVDLGYKHDRAAVAMAHVKEWVKIAYNKTWTHYAPVVQLDAVRYWTPTSTQNVSFADIEEYIVSLVRRGFELGLCTFDKWNSVSFRQTLNRDYGIKSELLSVAKPHYDDLATSIAEERLHAYDLPLAVDELMGLKIIRGNKIDHTSKGSKDVSDAIAGAVFNAVSYSKRDKSKKVEIRYLGGKPSEDKPVFIADRKPEDKPKMPETLKLDLRRAGII